MRNSRSVCTILMMVAALLLAPGGVAAEGVDLDGATAFVSGSEVLKIKKGVGKETDPLEFDLAFGPGTFTVNTDENQVLMGTFTRQGKTGRKLFLTLDPPSQDVLRQSLGD